MNWHGRAERGGGDGGGGKLFDNSVRHSVEHWHAGCLSKQTGMMRDER